MTNIRSSRCSNASTRWRIDAGSVPREGKDRPSLPRITISLTAWLLLQVGERVTRITVPGKALNPGRNQGPAHGRSYRNEQLRIVDPRGGLREQRIALGGHRRLPRRFHQLIDLGIADRHRLAAEAADEPGWRGRGGDLVDQREVGGGRRLRRLDRKPDRAPVALQLRQQ